MSTYIDTPVYADAPAIDWRKLTEARLKWLYGTSAVADRYSKTKADLAAWQALGSIHSGAAAVHNQTPRTGA